MSVPTSRDCPDLRDRSTGDPIGINYPGGSYVNKRTGDTLDTSQTQTAPPPPPPPPPAKPEFEGYDNSYDDSQTDFDADDGGCTIL